MLLAVEKSQLLMVDVQERLLPAMASPADVLRNGAFLLKGAGEFAVPVLVSEQYPKGIGRTVPDLGRLVGANSVYEKIEFSCYANPALRESLNVAGRQTIIFGIEAHVCVLQTAIDMAEAGHDVTVIADAVSSRAQSSKDLALRRMEKAGVRLATTEMVLFEWLGKAGSESFKRISQMIR